MPAPIAAAAPPNPTSADGVAVAILAFPEATASTIYGFYDVLLSAGRDWGLIVDGVPGPQLLRPRVVTLDGAPFTAANGVRIAPDCGIDACGKPDVVCVPEVLVPPGAPLDGRFTGEAAWLKRCFAAGATLATACSGALLLGEAGLLRGQDATTHWAYCDILAQRYEGVRVHASRALVATGEGQRLVMAGGGSSWLDLALFLIARLAGVEEAMRVARINLIDWHAVGQQPFARLARSRQVADAVIADSQGWIALHYDVPGPVAAMVQRSGLAERSFTRRFQQATGLSPMACVHTLRLEEAKQMLETGDAPIEAIANEVGYEDASFFGRLFRREVGLTPAQYRRRFGTMCRALRVAVAE